jgi:hypothetical protein
MARTCIIVTDHARARFITLETPVDASVEGGPRLVEHRDLVNPDADMPERALFSDRNGSAHASPTGAAHALDDHREAHQRETERRYAKASRGSGALRLARAGDSAAHRLGAPTARDVAPAVPIRSLSRHRDHRARRKSVTTAARANPVDSGVAGGGAHSQAARGRRIPPAGSIAEQPVTPTPERRASPGALLEGDAREATRHIASSRRSGDDRLGLNRQAAKSAKSDSRVDSILGLATSASWRFISRGRVEFPGRRVK